MNSAPDQPQQASPTQQAGGPPPRNSVAGRPWALRLERIQKYLAPLEGLGKQRVAWIGSVLLFIGIFLPIRAATIPFVNLTVSASFWDFAKLESLLLILLALASAGVAYVRDYKWLWLTGVVASFFLIIEFFGALTDTYFHPSWGWLVLFPSVVLILAAAAMRQDPRETSGNAVSTVRDLVRRLSESR